MARKKNEYIFAPEKQRKRGPGCLILLLSVLLAIVVLSYLANMTVNRKVDLKTTRVPVMALDRAFEGFTILHISDLHAAPVGAEADVWRTLLFGKNFSAVVLTGDMVGKTGDYQPLVLLIQTLRQINTTAPIYFVAGDEDPPPVVSAYRGTPEPLADWVLAAKDAGAIYLDAPVSQQVGRRTVWFTPEDLYNVQLTGRLQSLTMQKEEMEARGLQYEAEGGASYRAHMNRIEAMQRSVEAVSLISADDLQIAVTHAPRPVSYVRDALEWADPKAVFSFRNVSLVMAGHYVGGQWRLPFGFGALYIPEIGWLPDDEGILGMQRINSINQYISGGIGASGYYPMPNRFFNGPEVSLLAFTARIE